MTIRYLNADTGVDTGDGGIGAPWLTLAYAHTNSDAGDTLICQDSTANYALASITWTKNLTIQGEKDDASGAVFDGGGASVRWAMNSGDQTFQKITLQNANNNAIFFWSVGAGVTTTFANSKFELNLGSNGTENTYFHINKYEVTLNLQNCIFNDIGLEAGGGGNLWFIKAFTGTTVLNITGTTLWLGSTALTALIDGDISASIVTKNSIVMNATGSTIPFVNESWLSSDVTYSAFYDWSSAPTGTGVITSDPLFVDAANGYFNLRPTSPCIDTGTLT